MAKVDYRTNQVLAPNWVGLHEKVESKINCLPGVISIFRTVRRRCALLVRTQPRATLLGRSLHLLVDVGSQTLQCVFN